MKSTSRMFKAVLGWLIGLMVMAVSGQALAQGTWTTAAPMPTSRWASTVGAIDGKIIVAGGYNGSHRTTVETYDTLTNTWATKRQRGNHQTNAANGVIGSVLYAAGGTDCCVEINDLWAYDATADTWTQKAPLPAVRQAAGGGVINGQLHVVGGHAFGQILTSHHAYNPVANMWTPKASMPTARSLLGVGVVNGILYAVGGIGSNFTSVLATVEAYDPLTNTWTAKASMPTARAGLRVGVVNGVLYAVGGFGINPTSFLATVEAYDPLTNTWTTAASMPTARQSMGVGVVNGVLYAIGGDGPLGVPGLATNEAYTPDDTIAPTTTATPSIPPNGFGWNNSNVTETLSATDNVGGTGVQSITYSLSGAQSESWTTVPGNSAAVVITNEGTTTLTYYATDVAGNVESDHSVTIQIDKTAPSLGVPQDQFANATSSAGAVVNFVINASDLLSGLVGPATSTPKSSGETFPLGATLETATAEDRAGNTRTATFNVTVLPSRPIILVNGGSFVEDGNPHPATGTATDFFGAPVAGTFSFAYAPGGAAAPVTAGRYSASASFISSEPAFTNAFPWTTMAPDPHAKVSPAVTEINGKLYVQGFDLDSVGNQSSFVPRLSIYDPALDAWTIGPSPGLIRAYANAVTINGKMYVVGGCVMADCRIGVTGALEIYDPVANTWSNGAPMPTPRFGAAAGVIGGKLYVTGGSTSCPPCVTTSTTEIYDPVADSWTMGAPIPATRELASSAVVNGLLYVIGGYQRNPANILTGAPVGTVHVYDPVANAWSTRSPMPVVRFGAAVGVINGDIYVVGGADNASVPLAINESYNPATDTWTAQAPMSTARYYVSGDVVNSTLYVIDGTNGAAHIATNEAFDSSLTALITIDPATPPLASFTATPDSCACGQAVQFDASASAATTSGRHIVNWAWDFGDGTVLPNSGPLQAHAYGLFGTYTVTLTVTDDNVPPLSATTTRTVNVNQGNQAPIANAGGPYTLNAGTSVQLNGGNSMDPNTSCGDQIVTYAWTIDGTIHLSGPMPILDTTVNLLSLGPHTVSLTVADTFGATSTASTTVNVAPPTLQSITVTPSTTTIHPGQGGQQFTATGTFSDGSTQVLQSGGGGGEPLWQVHFNGGFNVDACTTLQYPNGGYPLGASGWTDQVFTSDPSTQTIVPTTWQPATPIVQVGGQITATQVNATLTCTTSSATASFSGTWSGSQYVGTFTDFAGHSDTVTITGSGGGNNGPNSPAWQVYATPGMEFAACATPQYPLTPGGSAFTSQNFFDVNGVVHQTWSAGTPVVSVDGTINASDVALTLACTNGAATGTIDAHWNRTRYEGTFSFNGGASTAQVSITGWSGQAPMPTARFGVSGASANGKVYAIGGVGGSCDGGGPCSFAPLTTVESYNPSTNTWASEPSLNVGRESAGVAAIGSMLYVIGGHIPGGDPSGLVEILDTSSPSGWTTLPQSDWMPTARAGLALVTDGAYLYAIGGNTQANNTGPVATVERFDPSAPSGLRWSTLAPMPAAGNASGAGVLNGTIIVVGSDGTSRTDVYDIATGVWHAGVPMPAQRGSMAVGVANGGMWVVGGTINGSPAFDTWVYYPATSTRPEGWAGVGSMLTARWALAAAVVDDVVYAIGGAGAADSSGEFLGLPTNESLSTPPFDDLSTSGGSGGGGSGSPTVQWQSTDPSVADVEANGFANPHALGQTTIVASVGSISCQTTNSCATLTVSNASPTVQITGRVNGPPPLPPLMNGPFTIGEGGSGLQLVADAHDPDNDPLTYAWSIVGPGTLGSQFGGTTSPSISYTNGDGPSSATVQVIVTDAFGASAMAETTITVSNIAPAVQVFGGSFTASETSQFQNFGTGGYFFDAGTNDGPWTVTVDYGDGTPAQTLSYTTSSSGFGTFGNFSLNHTYTDNGNYTAMVSVTDKDQGTSTTTVAVTVNNVAPQVSIVGSSPAVINEGSGLFNNGSFFDPGSDTWIATVNYGDGSGDQDLALSLPTGPGPGPTRRFNLSRVYPDNGTYTVTVTVRDDDGGVGSATLSVTVLNATPGVMLTGGSRVLHGHPATFNGVVFDQGANDAPWTGTVNYGDGSPTENLTLTLGAPPSFPQNTRASFTSTHTYAQSGPFTMTLTATDKDGATGTATFPINVRPVLVSIAIAPSPATMNALGQTVLFNATATFSDGSVHSTDGQVIDGVVWSSSNTGVATIGSGGLATAVAPGMSTIGVAAQDDSGSTFSAQATLTVDVAPPVITANDVSAEATSAAGAIVNFSFSATDDFDPSPTVSADHASGATYPIGTTDVLVTATDAAGNSSTKTFTVTVLSPEEITSNLISQVENADFQQASNLLQNVLNSLGKSNTDAACNQLGAFINEVQANNTLTATEASALIQSATNARAALGCP